MLAMKVATILLLSTIMVQAKPVEKREATFDTFVLMVQKYISENDFKALCDLTKQVHTLLTESEKEEDQKAACQKSLDQLKMATQQLENFHCQVDENRDEFAQVLDEVTVEDTASYQPNGIAPLSIIGICVVVVLVLTSCFYCCKSCDLFSSPSLFYVILRNFVE